MSEREFIEPDPSGDRDAAADEQVVHGMLSFLGHDDRGAQRDRVARLMARIDGEGQVASATAPGVAWRKVAPLVALAASVVIVFLVFAFRPERDLLADVRRRTAESGKRSYAVHVLVAPGFELRGRLDVRDPEHALLELATLAGFGVTVGRNAEGAWATDTHSGVRRYAAAKGWPRWLAAGGVALWLGTVDDLLARIDEHYEISETGDLIRATRESRGSEPDLVEIRLAEGAAVVERLVLEWQPRGRRPHPHHHGHLHLLHRAPGAGHAYAQRITCRLVPQPDLAEGWYDPETHSK